MGSPEASFVTASPGNASTSVPTDEAVVRWVLQAHPVSVNSRWEVLRDGLRGAGLPVESIARLS